MRWKLFALLTVVTMASFANDASPVGYWKTIDDATGKPKSIIQIMEDKDHSLKGKVIKIFSPTGESINKTCEACQGNKHNQPIVGMVVMEGLKKFANRWDKGQIIDPHSGKTYNCALNVLENGKQMEVRGYVGLPLLGRTQIWEKV